MKTLNHVFAKIKHRVDQACLDSCNEIANGIKDEAYKRANLDPNEVAYSIYQGYDNIGEFATYQSNFQVRNAESDGKLTSARAYNDFLVYYQKMECLIPYGNFIEWGTGRNASGEYDFTNEPWDARTIQQGRDSGGKIFYINEKPVMVGGTFGMTPCPHWSQARHLYDAKKKEIFSNNLRKLL